MRFERNLYAIVTLAVACSLLVAGLAAWRDSGAEESWRAAGYMQRIPVVPACCVVMAVGVILLGWHLLRLAGMITSMAELVEDDPANDTGAVGKFLAALRMTKADELHKAVRERLHDSATRTDEYESKIKD
ncbi:MAG: hypothetical protein KAV87_52885, partial [Desulfobacteraceae bacterium]|nr:hypothetical protein [Desulfobacteraceae bacterium]